MTQRAQFAATVTRLMAEDDKIVLLLGDIGIHSFKEAFERWPDRCLNVGPTEQASVGMAAGLAMAGLFPIFHTIDAFLVRRAYEQVYLDFGIQRLAGLFVTVGHDRDYAKLGPTHESPHGVDLMATVPGMEICEPTSVLEVDTLIRWAHEERNLAYIRLSEQKHA